MLARAAAADRRAGVVAGGGADPALAEAIRCYRRVLMADPTHALAHLSLGRALHRQGDHVGAEGHYRLAALCGGSQAALPWFNLAVLLEDLGRRAEAVAHYQAARERALAAGDHALLDDATGNLVALLHAGADVWSQREAVRVLAESRKQRGRG
jgi:tetratricopeptide (TPR) repeat protein